MIAVARLSDPQRELLRRVCLRRYTVRHEGYMGSFRPNATVISGLDSTTDRKLEGADRKVFRPSTLTALERAGLVARRDRTSDATCTIVPTRAGLAAYREIFG